MLTNKSDVLLAQKLIKKDFAIDDELSRDISQIEDLKKQLIPIINTLLNRDMNRLLNALYRIDVSEKKVKEILTVATPEEIAPGIADLIISRESQKVITRKKYKEGNL